MQSKTFVAGAMLAAGLMAGAVQPAAAQSAPHPAQYLAGNCANCHGTDGHSAGGGGMPGLAGLSKAYFVEQIKAFREGKRQATIMHHLSKGYTDEQIASLADFFSQQKP
jgi:cytochrome c553